MSLNRILLQRTVGEIVRAIGCVGVLKASMLVTRRNHQPLLLELSRAGDSFEARLDQELVGSSDFVTLLFDELTRLCERRCCGENELEILLTAELADPGSFIPASLVRIVDGDVVFRQISQRNLDLINEAVEIVQSGFEEGLSRSAIVCVRAGAGHWTIRFSGDSAYSNDFDLLVGTPPSFECKAEPAALKSRVAKFLCEQFVKADELELRIQQESQNGNRIEDLFADSLSGKFAEKNDFNPPA